MTNGEKLIEVFPSIELYEKSHDAIQINFDSVWWNAEYKEPTTKNDLGVDAVSRDKIKSYIQAHIHEIITESGEDKNKHTNRVLRSLIHGVNCMPSVTPQELILDKIRAEIWDLQYGDEEKSMNDEDRADAYNNAIKQVIEIIDRYKAESEEKK